MHKYGLTHQEGCRARYQPQQLIRTLYTRIASGERRQRKYKWKPVGLFCTLCDVSRLDMVVLKNGS